MESAAWVWQFNTDYLPEGSIFTHQGRSIPIIGPDDAAAPINDAYVKTHDGLYWMGNIYQHRLAPLESNLQELKDIYNTQGVEFTPWCVPKGHWPGDEAYIANKVLNVTNRLILDVEPYQWFWTGPWSNLHPYMQGIRAAHPNAWIGLSFDPRYGTYGQYHVDKYADIHFDEWMPYVDALLPQDYWATFGVGPIWEIGHTQERIGDYGKEIIHAIPGHAALADFAGAVSTLRGYGNSFSIWRRGTYAIYNADYVAGIQEEEEDPCADLEDEVKGLRAEVERLREANLIHRAVRQGTAARLDGIAKDLRG